jgi:hypothetical protein
MSLRLKIWLSILVLVTLFTLNSVVIYLEMENNKNKNLELSEKITPSINFLNDLRRNISDRTTFLSDWVHNSQNQSSREKLIDLHAESRNTLLDIGKTADNYSIPSWRDSIIELSNLFMNLSSAEYQVMSTLVLPDDYMDGEKINHCISYLETEIIPTSGLLKDNPPHRGMAYRAKQKHQGIFKPRHTTVGAARARDLHSRLHSFLPP